MTAFVVYEAQENADQTEGRGPMRTVGYYASEELAVAAVKGRGVMGVGDGEVVLVVYRADGEGRFDVTREKIYGHHKAIDGTWRYGYTDDRDLVVDPEWAEYVRLRNKFGGRF